MNMTKYSKMKCKAAAGMIFIMMAVLIFSGCGDAGASDDAAKSAAVDSAVKIECAVTVEGYCESETVQIPEGGSVYDALNATGADVSARKSAYGLYIEGINGRFEFDEGPTSGWVYTVNGERTSSSCDKFEVKAGDEIVWSYVDEL